MPPAECKQVLCENNVRSVPSRILWPNLFSTRFSRREAERKRARKKIATDKMPLCVICPWSWVMNSPSPKSSKKTPQHLWRKVGQRLNLANSNVFHGSLSSLNDLPHSSYHREPSDEHLEQEHTISLQNLPHFNPDSPRVKLRKKYGTFVHFSLVQVDLYLPCSSCSFESVARTNVGHWWYSCQCSLATECRRLPFVVG